MEALSTNLGRKFYGICIAFLGVHQFIYSDFRAVILPMWPSWRVDPGIWTYVGGLLLITFGLAIILERKAKTAALILGGLLLALVIFWHLPYMLFINPLAKHLGVWADAFKALALSGGAFVVAQSFASENEKSGIFKLLDKISPYGRIFFCMTMITFGIDHFLYAEGISTIVPAWIPGGLFWTYFAGAALIGAGVAIVIKFKVKYIALLLAIMIFIWLLVLHIPRAIADPYSGNGNEVASAADALGFSGIAFLLSARARKEGK